MNTEISILLDRAITMTRTGENPAEIVPILTSIRELSSMAKDITELDSISFSLITSLVDRTYER